jgi:hypothetical protein
MSLPRKTNFTLSWTLTDSQGSPINSATVTATLYSGRVNGTGGTVVTPINALPLVYVPGSAGLYSAQVLATLDPAAGLTDFVLVVEAVVAGLLVYHIEQPVVTVYPPAVDLTTLDRVKSWIGVLSSSDDANISACITAASMYWLWRTGRLPANGDVPLASPLVQPVAFNEWYSGNGSAQMFLRQTPIRTVTAVVINGQTIAQSTAYGISGWVIADDGKSLLLRPGGNSSSFSTSFYGMWSAGPAFTKGIMNINVQYQAGYRMTPPDIELACCQMIAVNYKRRSWTDQRSQAMAQGAGTISFRDWELPPEIVRVMVAYTPTAVT